MCIHYMRSYPDIHGRAELESQELDSQVYWILLEFTGLLLYFYWNLLECYWNCTGIYWILLEFTGFYCNLLDFLRIQFLRFQLALDMDIPCHLTHLQTTFYHPINTLSTPL